MWGIPFNLYAPYFSIYMLALGVKDTQIGLIATIGLIFQIGAAMMSGIITDKLGRKRTTFLFDFLAWTVPTAIWAVSQNFWFFVAAAIVNSTWRVTSNSWTCLMVEDTDPKLLMDIYSWVYISGLLSAFFAPIAGLLVNTYTLVPTMRGLLGFACVMMTAKFIVLNLYADETEQGKVRMHETKHQRLGELLAEYRDVIKSLRKSTRTLYTLGIMVIMGATQLITGTFWSILVTKRLGIPEGELSYFVFARSATMLIFFFVAMPFIREMHFRNPMLVGIGGYIIAQTVLILAPEKSYGLLLVSVLIEACSYATLGTQVDRMTITTVDPVERARIMAALYVVMILFTSPFGWISGALSSINRILPFVLNLVLFGIGAVLTVLASREHAKTPTPGNEAALQVEG